MVNRKQTPSGGKSNQAGRPGPGRSEASWGEVSNWLDDWSAIETDGTITAFSGKVELGTGVRTALTQKAHDHEIYMTPADTAVELRDVDALRKYAQPLEKLASRDYHRLYLAIAHRALGVEHQLAGEHAPAETRLRQALGLFTRLGAR